MTRMHDVALLDFPVAQFAQMQQHHDAMLREFSLIALGSDGESTTTPRRLVSLAKEMFERHGDAAAPFRQGVAEAVARGDAVTSLHLSIPYETLRWTEDFLMLFEEADEFCRDGQLLTPPSPPEVVEFRRWLAGELIRQIRDGAPATPYWTETL
ncbi:MAG TPA: hypothetical protein VM307_08000 [Egibacteraceae bacterium]|nr:hypothetical protein [Egibacteraceae bacterium]